MAEGWSIIDFWEAWRITQDVLTGYPLHFWFPAPTEKDKPVPERCTHKCVNCGMRYQHEAGTVCSKAKHKGCSKK